MIPLGRGNIIRSEKIGSTGVEGEKEGWKHRRRGEWEGEELERLRWLREEQ